MTLPSQQYANLAGHSYGRGLQGNDVNLKALVGKITEIDGVQYRVLAHADKPSGYQGTVYQRVDTGAIVVAHRGTEFGREPIRDGVLADGGMVFGRINSQAKDAIELTREALERARDYAAKRHISLPEVTVTGHSLGGTLAQITAHHFDLRGETFNAYGAASLGYRIPEGGGRVLNHVMAADAVSAASTHYGQVRIYATPGEIAQLQASGYHAPGIVDALTPDNPLLASVNTSHMMHNFLAVDGEGRRDRSVLDDPKARRLAADHARMIADYRGDVEGLRRTVASGLRGPGGLLHDGIEFLRGPLPAGEPARREAERNAPRHAPRARQSAPVHTGHSGLFTDGGPLPLPEYLAPQVVGPPVPLRGRPPVPPHDDLGPPAATSSTWRFGELPGAQPPIPDVSRFGERIDRMLAAAKADDWRAFRHDVQALASGDHARALRERAIEAVDRQEQSAAQQIAEQQRMEQAQPSRSRGFAR